jgi:hypothetical protein
MTNANIQIAQSSATLKTAGTLAGLWCLCVFCCFSSSAASIASVIRGLQSLPGTVVEDGEALKIEEVASMKLYKECEDTDFVEGFEAKLIKLSDDTVGSITTEDGVTIKKVKFENVGFKMTYVAVHEDDFEDKVTMEVRSYFGKGEMLLGDCPRPLTDVEEEHGKVRFIKDVNIEWRPAKNEPVGGLAVQEEIKDIEGYMVKK